MKLSAVLCVVACLLSIAVQILGTHEKGNDDDDYDNNIYENGFDSETEEEDESSNYEYNSQASNKRNSENSDSSHDDSNDDHHHKNSEHYSNEDGSGLIPNFDFVFEKHVETDLDSDYFPKYSKHDSDEDDDDHEHSKHDSDEDDDDHDDEDDNNHKHPKHHSHKCQVNEEKTDCVQPKDCVTCEHKDPCPVFVCNPGCNCKKGYFRNKFGICIKEAFCHKHTDEKCPRNEEPGCEQPEGCLTCENRLYCYTYVCNPGCVCKPDHYRNKKGVCVPEDKCPKEKCGKNEEFRKCGPVCEGCGDARCLSTACISKCYCKSGYFRNDDKKCVKKEDCPGHGHKCPRNEEWKDCVNPCSSCKYAYEPCNIKAACKEGCDCIDGYYRNGSGKCIPRHKCDKGYCD